MNKNIGKSLSKNVSSKYRQFFDHAKKSATNVIKFTSKRVIQKIAEATGDLIGDKFADAVFQSYNDNIARTASQNNSETVS